MIWLFHPEIEGLSFPDCFPSCSFGAWKREDLENACSAVLNAVLVTCHAFIGTESVETLVNTSAA